MRSQDGMCPGGRGRGWFGRPRPAPPAGLRRSRDGRRAQAARVTPRPRPGHHRTGRCRTPRTADVIQVTLAVTAAVASSLVVHRPPGIGRGEDIRRRAALIDREHDSMALVSDVSRGPGWWLASDGKRYPRAARSGPTATTTPWLLAPAAPPPVAPSRRPEAGESAIALSLLIGGAVCGIAGLALFFVTGFAGLLGSTVVPDSGSCRDRLARPGDYYVYQQTGTRVSGPVSPSPTTISSRP